MAEEKSGETLAQEAANEAAKKIKNGEIRVTLKEEVPIWADRKRKTIFALPWSFTRYILTPSRLTIRMGFFTVREEEIRLYRIRDVSYSQSLTERIAGTGTLLLQSSDASLPTIEMKHIKNAKRVKEVLSQAIEVARREAGVRTSEVVGTGGGPSHYVGDGHDHEAMGPELVPDFNQNGIDDRLE